jgi:CRP-like cAMP-binding protein
MAVAAGHPIPHPTDVLEALGDFPAPPGPAVRMRAATIRLRTGRWAAVQDAALVEGGIGFVVVAGALLRCVTAGHRTSAELLGPGDLLRPKQDLAAGPPFSTYWRVVEETELAVLDAGFTHRSMGAMALQPALVASIARRTETVARQLVIKQFKAVDQRVVLLLQLLGERWGRVGSEGILLPAFVSHGVISLLLGARRPSVTAAVTRLTRQQALRRRPDGRWVLAQVA